MFPWSSFSLLWWPAGKSFLVAWSPHITGNLSYRSLIYYHKLTLLARPLIITNHQRALSLPSHHPIYNPSGVISFQRRKGTNPLNETYMCGAGRQKSHRLKFEAHPPLLWVVYIINCFLEGWARLRMWLSFSQDTRRNLNAQIDAPRR